MFIQWCQAYSAQFLSFSSRVILATIVQAVLKIKAFAALQDYRRKTGRHFRWREIVKIIWFLKTRFGFPKYNKEVC
jgi:hypothetical protein